MDPYSQYCIRLILLNLRYITWMDWVSASCLLRSLKASARILEDLWRDISALQQYNMSIRSCQKSRIIHFLFGKNTEHPIRRVSVRYCPYKYLTCDFFKDPYLLSLKDALHSGEGKGVVPPPKFWSVNSPFQFCWYLGPEIDPWLAAPPCIRPHGSVFCKN